MYSSFSEVNTILRNVESISQATDGNPRLDVTTASIWSRFTDWLNLRYRHEEYEISFYKVIDGDINMDKKRGNEQWKKRNRHETIYLNK